jgi:hypothetical protein
MTAAADAKRRMWAIRLCGAVVVVLVCACAVTIFVDLYRDVETERLLASIQSAGGFVMRDERARSRPVVGIDLDATTVFDSGRVHQRGHVTDRTLLVVAGFRQLQELSLDGADVTDAGLVSLTGLKKLRRLIIARTHVTDSGIDKLKGLPKLSFVDLRGTSVTPEAVGELRRALPNAEVLTDPEGPTSEAENGPSPRI